MYRENERGFASIVFVVVLIVAAIGGAYYLGMQRNTSRDTASVDQIQTVVQVTPEMDETYSTSPVPALNSKEATSYTNPNNEFTFMYPKTWTVRYETSNGNIPPYERETELYFIGPNDFSKRGIQGITSDGISVNITNYRDPNPSLSLQDEIIKYAPMLITTNEEKAKFQPTFVTKNVGGRKALMTKVTSEEIEPGNTQNTYLLGVENNNKRLFTYIRVSGNQEEYMKTLDPILASFTFTK